MQKTLKYINFNVKQLDFMKSLGLKGLLTMKVYLCTKTAWCENTPLAICETFTGAMHFLSNHFKSSHKDFHHETTTIDGLFRVIAQDKKCETIVGQEDIALIRTFEVI